MSAIILSKFEYVKLNEAFTAVLLSSKGSKLLDIHVLLGNKRDSHNTNGAILDYPKYLLNGSRCTWRCCQGIKVMLVE